MADPKSASKNGRETRKHRPPARGQSAAATGGMARPRRGGAAAALRESEERLRVILDNVQTGVFIIDPDAHTIVDVNPAAVTLIGTPRGELLGTVCHRHICPAEVGHCPITDLGQAIDNSERVLLRSDGTRCSILKTVVPIRLNGRPHLLESFVDITARKAAEEQLRAINERLALATDAGAIGVWEWDLRTNYMIGDRRTRAIYGVEDTGPVPYARWAELVHPDDLPKAEASLRRTLKNKQSDAVDFRIIRPDGTVRNIQAAEGIVLDEHQEVVRIVGVIIDITARKQAEQAHAARTRQLEALGATTADLTRELDLAPLLRLLIARAAELVGAASATVYLWEPDRGVVVPAAWHGLGEWQAALQHRLGHGIAGTVAETRQRVVANDYRNSRYANPVTLERTAVTASLGEPLLYRDELIGAITLNHEGGRTFTEEDQGLLRLFANQAAVAIANARFFREERDGRAQLEAVRAVSAEITQELNLAHTLRLVAQRACALTRSAAADIGLWDPERQILVSEASYGHIAPRPATTRRLGEGAMGRVAETRRGMIINDYRSSPVAHPDTLAHTAITASLVEPLLYGDTLLGVIGVDHETPGRTFTPQDQEILRLFAVQAAIAIENARLYGEAERRRREAEVLASLAQTITASLDLDTVLQRVTEGARSLCDGDVAAIALRKDGSDTLTFRNWSGTVTAGYAALHIRAGQGLGGRVLVEGRPTRTADYRNDPDISPDFHHVAETEGLHAEIGVPVRMEGTVGGVLFVMRRTTRAFTDADEAILTRLADQAAVAITNARLFRDQQRAFLALQQAQDKLVRTEKLRGLGQMAAGIAHDLNNMLATILGQAELLRLRARHPEVSEGLQTLQTAANDGAQVVRRLQDFARQRSGGPLDACELDRLVPEALEITRPRWREEPRRRGIVIETVVDLGGLPAIQGNPAEIREMLTNLIFNAVDAMPSGGTLRFTGQVINASSRPSALDDTGTSESTPRHLDASAGWVELAVSDTGLGMTTDVQRRVFDPFFTTKGLHGTGLGLSVVYGIMERHGGRIDVTSAPGQGATFRLRFRPADPEAETSSGHATPAVVPSRRILLVDDDPAVRQTLAALLRASGQDVLEADGGAAGLRRLESASVDLVITDLGMPEVTGWDVARAAKARRPDLPVVLLTGWGDQVGAEAPADALVDRVLTKPVPRQTVLAVIAELTGPR